MIISLVGCQLNMNVLYNFLFNLFFIFLYLQTTYKPVHLILRSIFQWEKSLLQSNIGKWTYRCSKFAWSFNFHVSFIYTLAKFGRWCHFIFFTNTFFIHSWPNGTTHTVSTEVYLTLWTILITNYVQVIGYQKQQLCEISRLLVKLQTNKTL